MARSARRRGVGRRTRHAHRSAGGGDVCGALDVVLVVDRDHLCVSGVSEALRHTRLQIEDREDADRERLDHHRHDRRHDDQFDECEPRVPTRPVAAGRDRRDVPCEHAAPRMRGRDATPVGWPPTVQSRQYAASPKIHTPVNRPPRRRGPCLTLQPGLFRSNAPAWGGPAEPGSPRSSERRNHR